jgi:DNA-binding beta-propeller fold protein YncE
MGLAHGRAAQSKSGKTIKVACPIYSAPPNTYEAPSCQHDAGKLVIVRVTGKTLSRVAEAPIGHWSQGAVFSPDGKTLLVGNMGEKDYWVFQWDGSTLRDTGQHVQMTGGPAAIRTGEK